MSMEHTRARRIVSLQNSIWAWNCLRANCKADADIALTGSGGTDNLKVTDTETGEIFDAINVGENMREGKHWRVNLSHTKPTHPWRYFNEEEVRRSGLRRKIECLPFEKQHKRNNIEATMFHYSFHTRNGKIRYRGLLRHRLQAFHRCMWRTCVDWCCSRQRQTKDHFLNWNQALRAKYGIVYIPHGSYFRPNIGHS